MRLASIVLLALAPTLATAEPPPSLTCLARYYTGHPVERNGAWFFELPDGKSIPYDDGKTRDFAQKLETPDVKDTFSIKYRKGPIQPVSLENDDPGRIRVEALFANTYGKSESQVQVVPLELLGQRLRVHKKLVPVFERLAKRLAGLVAADGSLRPFLTKLGGTFNWRNIAGTDRQSAHSYGVSLDINVERSDYWRWQKGKLKWVNKIPQAIVDAFEAEGFIWGGRWYHFDTMHFEYRPELLDESCYP
jgi:hypothetical protein